MEEAWELAVVSSASDEYVANSRLKYNDLQDVTYSANTKFELVALTSVAVSYLDLACDSSIFGLRFEALNERFIEIGFLVASLALGLNYWLRYLDEGKVFSNIEQDLEDLKIRINTTLSEIKNAVVSQGTIDVFSSNLDVLHDLLNSIQSFEIPSLTDFSKELNASILGFKKQEEKIRELQNRPLELDPHGTAAADSSVYESSAAMYKEDAKSKVEKLKEEVEKLELLNYEIDNFFGQIKEKNGLLDQVFGLPDKLGDQLDILLKRLNIVSTTLVDNEVKPAKAKIRITIFMLIWPWVLGALVILSFVYAFFTQDHEPCKTTTAMACNGELS